MCVLSRETGTEAAIQKKYTTHRRRGTGGLKYSGKGRGREREWELRRVVGIRRSTCGTYYIGCQSENAPHSQGKQFKELFIISGTQRGRAGKTGVEGRRGQHFHIQIAAQQMTKHILPHAPSPRFAQQEGKMLLSPRRKLIEENFFRFRGDFAFLLILHNVGRRWLREG